MTACFTPPLIRSGFFKECVFESIMPTTFPIGSRLLDTCVGMHLHMYPDILQVSCVTLSTSDSRWFHPTKSDGCLSLLPAHIGDGRGSQSQRWPHGQSSRVRCRNGPRAVCLSYGFQRRQRRRSQQRRRQRWQSQSRQRCKLSQCRWRQTTPSLRLASMPLGTVRCW